MKPIRTYILYLLVLISLMVVFDRCLISFYGIQTGFVFLLLRTYVLTNSLGCLSLLLFYTGSAYRSTPKIILIYTLCFVLVSILGIVGSYYTIWYSNIPEETLFFQEWGMHLNLANMSAAFFTSVIFATIHILQKSKR